MIRAKAGRSKDADRGPNRGEPFKTFDEFRHDLEDLPRFARKLGIIDGTQGRMIGFRCIVHQFSSQSVKHAMAEELLILVDCFPPICIKTTSYASYLISVGAGFTVTQ